MDMRRRDAVALRRLLTERRNAVHPGSFGLTARTEGSGRRAAGLTQEQMDLLTDRTPGTFNRLENGRLASPSRALLERVAEILRLSEQEWTALWLYARGHHPPAPLSPESGLSVPGAWKEVVDGIGHMAYVNDASYNVLAHNAAFAGLFPGAVVPENIMRWTVLSPEARRTFPNWEHRWAPSVLPQLRAATVPRKK